MKRTLLTTLALVLVMTSVSLAEVKFTDTQDGVMQSAVAIQITGTLDSNSPTWNRGFNNADPPDNSCNFPLSDSSDGQYYAVFCLSTTDDLPIEVVVDDAGTTIGDTHMELYCDPFDPSDPLSNAVFSDDDDGVGLMSAFLLADNLTLNPSDNYWLVLTTFAPGDTGDFTINTSDNVMLCGSTPTESRSWSELKATYR